MNGYNNFGYGMDDLTSQFGNLNFGYNYPGYSHFGSESDSESDSSDDENDFGYSHFGNGSESDSSVSSDSEYDENDFGYSNFGYNSNFGYDGDNDFGKKMRKVNANAKKAMRLAHSEGISLKEAWKRVKKSGNSRRATTTRRAKTTRRVSSSKRKANSEAKKAMKLKHKNGISLKQAWKIVKKQRR